MHFIPEQLKVWEEPPQTEAEWEDALALYGKDRDEPHYRSRPPPTPSRLSKRDLVPRRGMEGSDDSDPEDIDPSSSMRARKRTSFGAAGMISEPPVCNQNDEDKWDGKAERKRLRTFYEKEGWLPGPLPSYSSKVRRRKVIRRLGLAGDAEADHERRTIITHYMEMAQMALQADDVGFAILRDDVGYKYSMDPDAEPMLCALGGTALSQFALQRHPECTVLGDMSRDWRTKANPFIVQKQMKFCAAVPLLYPRTDPPVAFGCLVVLGREARTVFSEREQAMLLRLSSMLVYQLATFQSELLAEKAAMMYERSIAFLRRAVIQMPEPITQPDVKVRRPKAELAVKTGPKAQLDAQRRSQATNMDLHQDGADTLRGILQADALAVIDMEQYQLFYQNGSDQAVEPVLQYLAGGWPEGVEPVIHAGKSPILAQSPPDRFDNPDSLITDLLVNQLKKRRFWWCRGESLGERVLALCPGAETMLVYFMITPDGRIQHLMLAAWNRPPASFADSSALSLPFVFILGELSQAAQSMRKTRAMERSQISYSNLQAHELRTPLHQILAITQLMRSNMLDLAETPPSCESYVNSLQQIRDLVPILDAIDTSGKTLHGIVDNILSFLDLKAGNTLDAPSGGPKALVDMLEEVLLEVHEDHARSRREQTNIETILDVDPYIGNYAEDKDGALRRVIAKLLSNAYKFIDGEGCVEIKVSNPVSLKGCQGACLSTKAVIEISDNGPGMDAKFVRDHLGEPWAKQDAFTTGSGLSVHLAYRIIDMMGGHMEVRSAAGRGCVVRLDVPVYRQQGEPKRVGTSKRVALVGFDKRGRKGLSKLGDKLKEQYRHYGADIVPVNEADLIVANGEVEEVAEGRLLMESKAEVIFLTMPGHEPHPAVVHAAQLNAKVIRRFAKPITPSVVRQTLSPARVHYEHKSTPSGGWKPKGMCLEEAIANLSLGDYFSSRKNRRESSGSSTPGTAHSATFDSPTSTPATSVHEPERINVLVVEDNMINRKILVKILSKLPVDIVEAADGVEAVERFSEMHQPAIALLDINMPRKDGFQACRDMRDVEKAEGRLRSEIIAVTALSADEEKKKGWSAGFDEWAVKPCGKAKVTNLVEAARKRLLGIREEPDPELDRRYTM